MEELTRILRNAKAHVKKITVSGNKPALVQRILEFQRAHPDINIEEDQLVPTDELIRSTFLQQWFLRALPRTEQPALQAGSKNEAYMRDHLPSFLAKHNVVVAATREYGFIINTRCPIIGDSPDGVLVTWDQKSIARLAMLECKTVTNAATVDAARTLATRHGEFIIVDAENTNKLKQLIPDDDHRGQVMQHAVAAEVDTVMYVKATMSDIVQIVIVTFPEYHRAAWETVLEYAMTRFCTDLSSQTIHDWGRAVDANSVDMHYNLRKAMVEWARSNGAIPITRYVKPTIIANWNRMKTAVDTVSRFLANIELSPKSGPDEYLWDRFLKLIMLASVKLFCVVTLKSAINDGTIKTMYQLNDRRNRIFGNFKLAVGSLGKLLSAEYASKKQQSPINLVLSNSLKNADPKAKRAWFGSKEGQLFRADTSSAHEAAAQDQREYCCLCSANFSVKIERDGKMLVKKRHVGAKPFYKCSRCLVFLCRKKTHEHEGEKYSCYDFWHMLSDFNDWRVKYTTTLIEEKSNALQQQMYAAAAEVKCNSSYSLY